MEYPSLSDDLGAKLAAVPASFDGVCEYRPCLATLKSGDTRDYVYVVDADRYIRAWGMWPEDDPAKASVSLHDVVDIGESPHRLPADLANKLYDAGESGMGTRSSRLRCETGDGFRTWSAARSTSRPSHPA